MPSPYQTPQHFEPVLPEEPSRSSVSWPRLLMWAAGLWMLQGALWTFMSAIAISAFQAHPDDILHASSHFWLVGHFVVQGAAALCYAVLAYRAPARPALHVSLVLMVFLASDAVIDVIVFDASLSELSDGWYLLRSAAAAFVGYVIARTVRRMP